MKIRGKFTVLSHLKTHYYRNGTEVEFVASYDTTIPEDQQYAEATPSGRITMTVKESVAEQWPLGKQFYVDITPVEETTAAE